MHWLENKIPPPLVGLTLALAMWGLSPSPEWAELGALRKVLTITLVLAGLAFDGVALLAFLRARTTVNPLRPGRASTLVATGVYRITRNPMYLGMALLLCALAIVLDQVAAFAGPVLFAGFITRFQIIPEERAMAAKFGNDFTEYCRHVRRWL